MAKPLSVTFVGASEGEWRIERIEQVRGEGLQVVERLAVLEGDPTEVPPNPAWTLRGATSNERYVTQAEHERLVDVQPALERPGATRAALIAVRKSDAWWNLSQDERRHVFEERSHHVALGMDYLPAVARRLHHCRDLGEPFDFLTWFEYSPDDTPAFEELVRLLRATEEWSYVEREVDIRVSRE